MVSQRLHMNILYTWKIFVMQVIILSWLWYINIELSLSWHLARERHSFFLLTPILRLTPSLSRSPQILESQTFCKRGRSTMVRATILRCTPHGTNDCTAAACIAPRRSRTPLCRWCSSLGQAGDPWQKQKATTTKEKKGHYRLHAGFYQEKLQPRTFVVVFHSTRT